jgi:hypothetical protein
MNSVERHKKYAEDLSQLVKDSKGETKRVIYNRLSLLAAKANGNPVAYQRLVGADRKNMMRLLIAIAFKEKAQAEKLGRDFGRDRRTIETPV